jgi:hypothetical protein
MLKPVKSRKKKDGHTMPKVHPECERHVQGRELPSKHLQVLFQVLNQTHKVKMKMTGCTDFFIIPDFSLTCIVSGIQ